MSATLFPYYLCIFDKIKDILSQSYINSVPQKVIKIVESKLASDDQQRQNIQEAKRIVQEGIALYDQQKYQEAIECYDKAISINPKDDVALSNQGSTLHKLQKYQDAILCFDQALSICSNPVRLKLKADSLMNQETKMKLNNFIWLHWKKDIVTSSTYRNNYQSYEVSQYCKFHIIKSNNVFYQTFPFFCFNSFIF